MAMWGGNTNWRMREELMRIKAQEREQAIQRAAAAARVRHELAEPSPRRSRVPFAGLFRWLQS